MPDIERDTTVAHGICNLFRRVRVAQPGKVYEGKAVVLWRRAGGMGGGTGVPENVEFFEYASEAIANVG
jgi:hypothetical protein